MPRRQNLPRYVCAYKDGRGRLYVYFMRRKGAAKVRMRERPWSPAFMDHYTRLLAGKPSPTQEPVKNTLRWLVEQYLSSPAFRGLAPSTRGVRERVLEACLSETVAPGDARTFGALQVRQITTKAIRVLRDRKADLPEAANVRLEALRQVFAHGVEYELCAANPARDVPNIRTNSTGFHSWTPQEVERYEATHAIGTRARLALALLLYTAQRRGDVVRFGRRHVRDGWLCFTQAKNKERNPKALEIPLRPELADIIARTETVGVETFPVTG